MLIPLIIDYLFNCVADGHSSVARLRRIRQLQLPAFKSDHALHMYRLLLRATVADALTASQASS